MSEFIEEQAQELIQQAESVADTPLPHDYDAKWLVVGANQEIRNLLRQMKEYLIGQHNDELAKLHEEFGSLIAAEQTSNGYLIDKVARLETALAATEERALKAETEALTAQDLQKDAEKKRNNAVIQKEEAEAERDKAIAREKGLKGQIDELEGMLRTYRSRSSSGHSGGLVFKSTIKPETVEERDERLERERIETINRSLMRHGSAPLPLPVKQIEEALAEVAASSEPNPDDRFPADAVGVDSDGLDEADTPVEVAREESTVEERLTALEEWKLSVEERIAGLHYVP